MKNIFSTIKKASSARATARQAGFAMIFTVLVISIIMTIAIGISDVTYKQGLLSSIAKDSLVAFYAADAGVECGLYYDLNGNLFPRGLPVASAPQGIACGENTFSMDSSQTTVDYYVYKENVTDANKPCRTIVFNKQNATVNLVQSRGYSMCSDTPRQVERALEVRY